jgi:N-acetylgalactosamine kinase
VTAPTDARAAALVTALPGDGPVVLARAPGRVNLIGEHTDYNGLPVLPFAIACNVLVAARPRADAVVEITNVDPRFPARRFRPVSPIAPLPPGDWGTYVQAASQALLAAGGSHPAGATLRVDGNIPPAAGVSSSSALVVACALALQALGGGTRDRLALADLLARGEQYVGTLSGGMDQAAILLGRPGQAVRLDFFPLRARAVAVPPNAAFVVAHSLDEAAKAGVARGLYNQRVIECRLACAVLARRLGCPLAHLGDLPDPAAVRAALPELLPDGAVSRAALVTRLGLARVDVEQLAPPSVTLADADRFVLRARVRHVLAEAARVAAAEQALVDGDLRALGALLDESHASGAADYGTSTPRADALVRLARASGALGARLMGAGFGGAALLLVERERTVALMAALDRRFYHARGAGAAARFVVAPSDGAGVARVDCQGAVC